MAKKTNRKVETKSSDGDPAEFRQDLGYDELVEALVKESPIGKEHTARTLAECIASMRMQLRNMRPRQEADILTGDEVRALPALASNMRRLLESLGSTRHEEDDWEF